MLFLLPSLYVIIHHYGFIILAVSIIIMMIIDYCFLCVSPLLSNDHCHHYYYHVWVFNIYCCYACAVCHSLCTHKHLPRNVSSLQLAWHNFKLQNYNNLLFVETEKKGEQIPMFIMFNDLFAPLRFIFPPKFIPNVFIRKSQGSTKYLGK